MLVIHSRARRAARPLCVAIATALLCASAGAPAASAAGGDQYLVLPRATYSQREAGRELVHDYGPFELWRMDGGHAAEIRSAAGNDARPVDTAIAFEAGAFDPLNQRFAVPALHGFQPGRPSGISIELVQFAGPIADAWERRLAATGVKVLQYIPNNAYAVLADGPGRAALAELQRSSAVVRLAETLPPIYKLNAVLAQRARAGLSATAELDVSIVLARHAGNDASKRTIRALAVGTAYSDWSRIGELESISLRVKESDLEALAALPDVFALEDYRQPELLDELQNQIIAGNFNGGQTTASGPGYLAWLTGQGFSTNPADYPIVSVVDDGIGNGTAVLGAGDLTLTRDGANAVSRVSFATNCTTDTLADGRAGHGHINASIVGGFDGRGAAAGIQFPFEDPNGFLRGQGVNPYARVANTKFFNNAGNGQTTNCGGSQASMIRSQHLNGARISSNSWGAPVGGDYNAESATYDAAVRDADGVAAGLQPMIFVFAAGNNGSGAATIGSPGTGKNVITVGASENARPDYTDLCDGSPVPAPPTVRADNAMDVIDFSSRGPAEGSRIKPELIAPGTHIQGTASTAAGYDGTGVCAQFIPAGQTDFASSSGTSHSAPALAGVSSLVYRYLQTTYGITPSAAMTKAYLMAHPTYLTGVSGNGNLPTNSQGFGMPNLRLAFDASTGRVLRDQATVLGATGQIATQNSSVADPAKPLRIALAWSDAPGATSADPKVNNLNLEVDVGGNTFRGNVFTGQNSTAGGVADANNNYEAVFLPAGTSGPISIRVIGANIAGDGVPGNADATDQDFALVCSNCVDQPDFFVSANVVDAQTCGADTASWSVSVSPVTGYTGTATLSAVPPGGTPGFTPASGAVPLASTFTLGTAGIATGMYTFPISATDGVLTRSVEVSLQHDAAAPAAPVLASPAQGSTGHLGAPLLQWNAVPGISDYIVELDTDAGFGSVDYSATVSGTSHAPAFSLAPLTQYFWRVRGSNLCGAGANSAAFSFTTADAYCATPAAAIPDGNLAGVSSTITVPAGAAITDLDVIFEIRHTWVGDVSASLRRNAGTARTLINRPGVPASTFGCSGDNANIVLDDEGTGAVESTCTSTIPAYPVGARRTPDASLAIFDGLGLSADWTLTVVDHLSDFAGTLDRWCLVATQAPATVVAASDTFPVTEDVQLNQSAPGVLGNDTGAGLTATLLTPPVNGNLTFNADGSFSYLPLGNACGGSETFTYRATDGVGVAIGTVTLNLACVNDLPTVQNDAFAGFEDTAVVVAAAQGVLVNDADIEAGPLTAVDATDPANGAVTLNTDGGFSYTPDANYCDGAAPDTFTYRANDGTASSLAAATVGVTIACVNDAPAVSAPISDRSDAEGALIGSSIAAAFAEVDSGQSLTFSADVLPAGLAMNAAGLISGTLALTANAASPYSVTVTASDGNGGTATDTFVWTVTNTNQLPAVAAPISDRSDAEGSLVSSSIASAFTDADAGATLTFSADVLPPGLTMSTAGLISGTIGFTANAASPYTVTVTADDGDGGTVTDTFVWTVTNTNQPPVVAAPVSDRSDAEGSLISSSIASAFSDADAGAVLTFSADVLPAGLAMDAAGLISGTIAFSANAASPYSVTVTASDGNGGAVTDTFLWTVTDVPQNVAPVVADQAFVVTVGSGNGTLVGTVASTDANVGDTRSVSVTGGTGAAVLAVSVAGAITVANSAGLAAGATLTLEVMVTDAGGLSDTATVSVVVQPLGIFANGLEGN
jgi:VCBS repeat-containing protein